jgi:hypothetical protein
MAGGVGRPLWNKFFQVRIGHCVSGLSLHLQSVIANPIRNPVFALAGGATWDNMPP